MEAGPGGWMGAFFKNLVFSSRSCIRSRVWGGLADEMNAQLTGLCLLCYVGSRKDSFLYRGCHREGYHHHELALRRRSIPNLGPHQAPHRSSFPF